MLLYDLQFLNQERRLKVLEKVLQWKVCCYHQRRHLLVILSPMGTANATVWDTSKGFFSSRSLVHGQNSIYTFILPRHLLVTLDINI